MIFLNDWQWIWFKNYFEDIKSRKSSSIYLSFSVFISFFQYQSKILRVIELTKKRINFLFNAVKIYFPLSILMNILTLYYICYLILAMYLLDSDREPSYNSFKIFYYCQGYWLLKLIVDMANDSTPPQLPCIPFEAYPH